MELLLGSLIGGAIVYLYMQVTRSEARERAKQWDVSIPANQESFLKHAALHPRKPINAEAFRTVFAVAENVLEAMPSPYRLLAEVSMGSFIGTHMAHGHSKAAADRAFRSYNSKRVDFLVIDPFGLPVLVIEYQGSGHYQGNALERDAVKRLTLERAGIPLLEIAHGAHSKEVQNKIQWWINHATGKDKGTPPKISGVQR